MFEDADKLFKFQSTQIQKMNTKTIRSSFRNFKIFIYLYLYCVVKTEYMFINQFDNEIYKYSTFNLLRI